jgi:hypothetical protein
MFQGVIVDYDVKYEKTSSRRIAVSVDDERLCRRSRVTPRSILEIVRRLDKAPLAVQTWGAIVQKSASRRSPLISSKPVSEAAG